VSMLPIDKSIRFTFLSLMLALSQNCAVNADYEGAATDAERSTVKPAAGPRANQSVAFDPWKLLDLALSPAHAYATTVSINIDRRVVPDSVLQADLEWDDRADLDTDHLKINES